MTTHEMQKHATETSTEMSWSDSLAYADTLTTDAAPEHRERYGSFDVVRDLPILNTSTSGSKEGSGLQGSGLHPVLSTPFRPLSYSNPSDSRPITACNTAEIDHFILREIRSGRDIDFVTHSVAQQYGVTMTTDDALLSYRSAYWRAKSWESRDTQLMEEVVLAEVRGFWERVASKMREKGSSEWPPHEVKMRFLKLHSTSYVQL